MDHTYISVCVHISRKLKVLKTSNGLRPPNSRKWAWTPGHRDAKGDLWHSWSFQNHSLTTHIWVFTYSQINTKCSISWAKSRILGPSCKPAWFISTITEPLTVPPRGRGGCGIQFKAMVLKLKYVSEPPGGLTQTQTAGPHPRVSDTGGLGWGRRSVLLIRSQVRLRLQDRGPPLRSTALRSLAGYSPWGHKDSDITEHTCYSYCATLDSRFGE